MNCPRCAVSLDAKELGRLCPDCEGCWLDFSEFNELLRLGDEQLEGSELAATLTAGPRDEVPQDRYLRCPLCGARMRRHIYLLDSGVVVDECREHGIWLDDGELGKIRSYDPNLLEGREQERAALLRRLLSSE